MTVAGPFLCLRQTDLFVTISGGNLSWDLFDGERGGHSTPHGIQPLLHGRLLARTIHQFARSPTNSPSIPGTSWSSLQVHYQAKWGAPKRANKNQGDKRVGTLMCWEPTKRWPLTCILQPRTYFPRQCSWLGIIMSVWKWMWKLKQREDIGPRMLSKSVAAWNTSLSNLIIFTSPFIFQ